MKKLSFVLPYSNYTDNSVAEMMPTTKCTRVPMITKVQQKSMHLYDVYARV